MHERFISAETFCRKSRARRPITRKHFVFFKRGIRVRYAEKIRLADVRGETHRLAPAAFGRREDSREAEITE